MPRDGVKKERGEIGRGPREQYRSVPRDGVKKKRERTVEDRESGVSLCHKVALKKRERERERERDRSWTEREVHRFPSIRYK